MKILFLAMLLLTIFTSVYMSRLAKQFVLNDGRIFSIMDLEIPKEKLKIEDIKSTITYNATLALEKHLQTDALFMVGCFSSIALLCLIAASSTASSTWRLILIILAILQLIAWGLDIVENKQLYKFLFQPDYTISKTSITIRTIIKFAIGIVGFLLSTGVIIANSKIRVASWKKV